MIEINFESDVNVGKTRELLGEILADPMGGWAVLPFLINEKELNKIKKAAADIQNKAEVLVCIGIGG